MREPVPSSHHVSEITTLCHNWRINKNAPADVLTSSREPHPVSFDDIDCNMDGGGQQSDTGEAGSTDDWQWVMVTDPTQSRDKDTMRNVRTHVMNNYLSREQKNPNSTDVRVRNPHARRSKPRAPPRRSSFERAVVREPETQENSPTRKDSLAEIRYDQEDTEPYLATGGPDARYDAFEVIPKFENTDIDVVMLKANCTTYFGSRAMCRKWTPLLLSARQATLSTLYIASAYLDMMQVDCPNPINPRIPGSWESVRTLSVRDETVRVINQSLSDPETCSDDANIISVLQMFCGDMVVAEDQMMLWHERGMWSMVVQRGGLDRLGGNGVIASMLTLKVLELAIVRESRPRQEYIDYAHRISKSAVSGRRLVFPESPLYCPSGNYRTFGHSKACSANTLEVINTARDLTQVVLDTQKWSMLFGPAPAGLETTSILEARKRSLISRALSFCPNPQDPVYEAIRLCTLLYASAISRNTSFSETARWMGMTGSTGDIAISIRKELMRTNLSNCWENMVGVLFWILLVSSAACSDRQQESYAGEAAIVAARDPGTRKWFAALIIRCSILLGFQHAEAIVRSLQALLAVQEVLRGGNDGMVDSY